MNRGTALPWFGMGIGRYPEHESGISIVDAIPDRYSFSYELTEEYINALREGKVIEIRVGSMGTNEYQVYLSLPSQKADGDA